MMIANQQKRKVAVAQKTSTLVFVKNVLERAKAFRLKPLWEKATAVHAAWRKPRLFVLFDMLFCSIVYKVGFAEYVEFDFAILHRKERKTYLSGQHSNLYAHALNKDAEAIKRLNNKTVFLEDFQDLIGRTWIDIKTANKDEIREFAGKNPLCFVKDPFGLAGRGVCRIDSSELLDEKKREEFVRQGLTLAEEVIQQHEEMSKLAPNSVNTVRAVTFLDRAGKVHFLLFVLKMGTGDLYLDNTGAGGLSVVMDEDGVVRSPAKGTTWLYSVHPDTNTPIVGFTVPHFEALKERVAVAARRVPTVPYIGWDVAITPSGPVLVEANPNTGVWQNSPVARAGVDAAAGRSGLRERYRRIIGF